ncbi:acetylornithine deacetylase [Psychrobacter faecalis]|jgi:acetylornithine deacetylase|uniref:Acetylornithine deacetylase n=1 Tax=Psychrobacter faecalis TaxID=180588 RepID=A0ABT9HKF7_9GAMM|nr:MULTISPECIES: acetylornithine deacetylase [Psychrobacter]MCG3860977.1 acetylornithine deacetylase [Psychrobacter sp. Ps5]MDP4545969.1 acetylornithine deacetylase [Psychrobacter faecalis]PKG83604.1 acetylornithine deacetylase [Psychrobacter sp. Sarcosine-02u-2]
MTLKNYDNVAERETPNTHYSIGNYPNDSIDWLTRLIAFDTVSRHSNLALIDDVKAYCEQLGLTVDLTFNDTKNKANLFVTVPAGKDADEVNHGLVLSGHTDVVPVDGQDWTSEPFTATIRGDKIFGRGACDMKGFIACALTLLPQAVKLSNAGQLRRPLHLALSFDEEVGCLGAPLLLADLKARGITPDYCIVGEPTNMTMVVAHKGIAVYRCRVHGKSAHSSLTAQGVNAISYASRLIGYVDELAQEISHRSDNDALFDVPYSTLSVGTIQGGTATNIVPNLCEFTFDYRNLPHMTQDDILVPIAAKVAELSAQMQARAADTGIELLQEESVPAMTDSDSAELQALIIALTGDDTRHKVAYATEGGQFTNSGIPTIICGPGSIEQAHKADEYVALSEMARCDEFLQKLLNSCAIN